jgi:hypothetical protein
LDFLLLIVGGGALCKREVKEFTVIPLETQSQCVLIHEKTIFLLFLFLHIANATQKQSTINIETTTADEKGRKVND